MNKKTSHVVQQTSTNWIIDPGIEVRPIMGQMDDLVGNQ